MADQAIVEAERRLRAELGGDEDVAPSASPRTWDPRGGDDDPLIVGRLVGVITATTRYGDARVATQELADGSPRAVWITAKTLEGAWHEAGPKVGEVVGVRYRGDRETAEGQRTYAVFTVDVDRGDDAVADDIPF